MYNQQDRAKEEISQARARMTYIVIAEVYLLILARVFDIDVGPDYLMLHGLMFAVVLYTSFLLLYVPRVMSFSPLRQTLSIVVDIGVITSVMYELGGAGAVFYPLYLWVISGNGLRFGIAYLRFAMALGLIGFSLLIAFNPYWLANKPAGFGLLLGVLVLPSFFSVLIRRLHDLNARLHEMVEAKDYQASHDALTGLCNRYCFKRRLDDEISRADRNGHHFSLLYLDLDGFKPVNDNYGHMAGDLLLKSVAARLLAQIRSVDLAVRLGGDEFAVVTMSGAGKDETDALAQRIEQAISQPHQLNHDTMSVGVSIGIARFPDDGTDAESLMRVADARMYRRKG